PRCRSHWGGSARVVRQPVANASAFGLRRNLEPNATEIGDNADVRPGSMPLARDRRAMSSRITRKATQRRAASRRRARSDPFATPLAATWRLDSTVRQARDGDAGALTGRPPSLASSRSALRHSEYRTQAPQLARNRDRGSSPRGRAVVVRSEAGKKGGY